LPYSRTPRRAPLPLRARLPRMCISLARLGKLARRWPTVIRRRRDDDTV